MATLEFLKNKEIVLFLGKPGTGKTHIALSIGLKAVEQGYKVYCSSMKKLSAEILAAKAANTLDTLFRKILYSQLWILDDFAVVSLRKDVAEEVFDLFDRRAQTNSLILTSNRDIEEWPQVFAEPILATAAIDRLFDNSHICTFEGKSYRLNKRIIMKNI